jgi:hypothetical protein
MHRHYNNEWLRGIESSGIWKTMERSIPDGNIVELRKHPKAKATIQELSRVFKFWTNPVRVIKLSVEDAFIWIILNYVLFIFSLSRSSCCFLNVLSWIFLKAKSGRVESDGKGKNLGKTVNVLIFFFAFSSKITQLRNSFRWPVFWQLIKLE